MKTALRLIVAAFVLAEFNVFAATHYVSLESTNPVAPFATWETAATNIQDAVDAAKAGDTVLVTNGVYAVGGRAITNELGDFGMVVITNTIKLESVNGPDVTKIDGGGSVQCVYLGERAVLSGFILTNGYTTADSGGGGAYGGTLYDCTLIGNRATGWKGGRGGGAAWCTLHNCNLTGNSTAGGGGGAVVCILHNCTITDNSAECWGGGAEGCILYDCTLRGNSAGWGGGAFGGIFYNCILANNAAESGGGTFGGTIYNCTVVGNSAATGGGVYASYADPGGAFRCTAVNCIIDYNTAPTGPNYWTDAGDEFGDELLLNYCLTSPLFANGVGNITGPPLFMDMAAGDFRLREGSPCVDAGTNLMGVPFMGWDAGNWGVVGHVSAPTDILGNTRFIDGNGDGVVAWDLGAYEFNSFRPPRFAVQPQLTADGWKLNITGAANQWVHLQRSSNLKDWEDIWSGFMGAEEIQQVNDGDTGQKATFYRVVVP